MQAGQKISFLMKNNRVFLKTFIAPGSFLSEK